MADKLLKSIKFPTLPDRYVIGDSTLTEEGAAADAKAVGDALATKADTKGTYGDLIVGGAEQLMADGYETDSDPYLFRPTGGSADVGNREYVDKIVGGTVAWNQLVSASATSVTVQSGHKYIAKIGGAWSVVASSGSAISVTGGTDMVIDLTAMFGTTIADYIYSLEIATAGAGVAFFKKLFNKPYYAYNAGELMSVKALRHITRGFNAFDKSTVGNGYVSNATGDIVETSGYKHSDYIKVVPNTIYCITSMQTEGRWGAWYDADKKFISGLVWNASATLVTSPSNAVFVRVTLKTPTSGDIDTACINLSWDGERDGEYEEYVEHVYELDPDLELRGIPKLSAGNDLYYDGDVYEPDGTVTRKYGIVDLGTLNWSYTASYAKKCFYTNLPLARRSAYGQGGNLMCTKYVAETSITPENLAKKGDKLIAQTYNSTQLLVIDDESYTDDASFKAAMSGVMLVYELATPTTETAEGYEHYQTCDPSGTEEFVTTGIVPIGHETRYPHDLKKKIETAPDSPSTDGTYLMKRSGGKNAYMALPSTPSANGSYVLTVTVSGGTASYSWTAKE